MERKAELVYREKRTYSGGLVEMLVWRVPTPVPPSEHPLKYRLVYVRDGRRVVGYDNERGKGDHRHLGEKQLPYKFVDELQLLSDFWQDVREATT